MGRLNTDLMFSSKSDEWETPQDFFDKLDKEFRFTLDPCATHENAKCKKYYTKKENGLYQSWAGETVFMNPPYGREVGKWVKKAYYSSLKPNTIVVCLIPSRTDTRWFHDYCLKGEIRFIKGRLKFQNRLLPSWREDGTHKVNPAPFPSMIVIFGVPPKRRETCQ